MQLKLGAPMANLGTGQVFDTPSPVESPVFSTLSAGEGISLGPVVGRFGGAGVAYFFTPVSGRTYRIFPDGVPDYVVILGVRWSGSGTTKAFINGVESVSSATHFFISRTPDSEPSPSHEIRNVRFDFSGSYRVLIAGSSEPFYNIEPPAA